MTFPFKQDFTKSENSGIIRWTATHAYDVEAESDMMCQDAGCVAMVILPNCRLPTQSIILTLSPQPLPQPQAYFTFLLTYDLI